MPLMCWRMRGARVQQSSARARCACPRATYLVVVGVGVAPSARLRRPGCQSWAAQLCGSGGGGGSLASARCQVHSFVRPPTALAREPGGEREHEREQAREQERDGGARSLVSCHSLPRARAHTHLWLRWKDERTDVRASDRVATVRYNSL